MGSASEKDELLVFSTVDFNLYGEPTILNPSTLWKGRDVEAEEEKNKKKTLSTFHVRGPRSFRCYQGITGKVNRWEEQGAAGGSHGIKSKAEKDFF